MIQAEPHLSQSNRKGSTPLPQRLVWWSLCLGREAIIRWGRLGWKKKRGGGQEGPLSSHFARRESPRYSWEERRGVLFIGGWSTTRGEFRANQHGQQDVPTNKRQQGDINTNHSPPSALASPSWCVQRSPPPPKAPRTLHTRRRKRRKGGERGAPHHRFPIGGFSPSGCPASEE